MDTIVNKVAESGIITLDLSGYLPDTNSIVEFDIKPFLFRELILKEKDFRASLQELDWEKFRNLNVAVICSTDAIIPVWAYMLVATYLNKVTAKAYYGTTTELFNVLLTGAINAIDVTQFNEKRVVVKGCGDIHVPELAYVLITQRLAPVVKSIMYGEPCSTVPIMKAPKA